MKFPKLHSCPIAAATQLFLQSTQHSLGSSLEGPECKFMLLLGEDSWRPLHGFMDVFSLCAFSCSPVNLTSGDIQLKSLFPAGFLSVVIVLRGNGLTPASSNIWESACPQQDVIFLIGTRLVFL